MIEFRKISDFPRGTLYDILVDAYSFDERNRQIWDADWKESDRFFYDHPDIADRCGLVTCLDGEPIGFVTWDPQHLPDYVEDKGKYNAIMSTLAEMLYREMRRRRPPQSNGDAGAGHQETTCNENHQPGVDAP